MTGTGVHMRKCRNKKCRKWFYPWFFKGPSLRCYPHVCPECWHRPRAYRGRPGAPRMTAQPAPDPNHITFKPPTPQE